MCGLASRVQAEINTAASSPLPCHSYCLPHLPGRRGHRASLNSLPTHPFLCLVWLVQPLDGVALIVAAEAAAAKAARSTAECVVIAEAEERQAATAAALSSEVAEETSGAALGYSSFPLTSDDDYHDVSGANSSSVDADRPRLSPNFRPAAAAAGELLVDVPLPLEGEPSSGAVPCSLLDDDGRGGSSSAPFSLVQGIERHSTSRGR